jgi:hypothetical protein
MYHLCWRLTRDDRFFKLELVKPYNFQNCFFQNACTCHLDCGIIICSGNLDCMFMCFREKPGDDDYVKLDMMKIPYYLNLAQCELLLQDFYPAIEHTTEVLKRDAGK